MENPNGKKTLMVIFGGVSPEHEVSVITGLQVIHNANPDLYNVIPVYVSKAGQWYTGEALRNAEIYKVLEDIPYKCSECYLNVGLIVRTKGLFQKEKLLKIDVVFLAFHGGQGESGQIQGLLEIKDIPYVGSGVLGSSLGMDKVVMKQILQQNGIKVAPYIHFYKNDWQRDSKVLLTQLENELKYPMFVKPANSGSSIGMSKVANLQELENAIEVALTFDRKVIIETGVTNFKEINVSVIGNAGADLTVSECEEVFASSDFLNYEDKYVGEGGKSKGMASTKRQIPANIKPETKKLIQDTAQKAFTVLNAGGLARIDFLVNDETQEYCLIEINTIPGSMAFYLWEASNLPFSKMIDKLVETAFEAYEFRKDKTTTFASNILSEFKSSMKAPKLG